MDRAQVLGRRLFEGRPFIEGWTRGLSLMRRTIVAAPKRAALHRGKPTGLAGLVTQVAVFRGRPFIKAGLGRRRGGWARGRRL